MPTSQEILDLMLCFVAVKTTGIYCRSIYDYAKMRGLSNPDIYLTGDLGIKKSMDKLGLKINPKKAKPFRSYLTFQLWDKL
jgi:hypothetical protein